MSSQQSNRTPDIQPVPCSSTAHLPFSRYSAVRPGCGHTASSPSGNKQEFFHTGHLCESCSYTVTDVLEGSTKLPWKSSQWMKKSPSQRDSNRREGRLPLVHMARKTKTPSLQGSEGVFLFAVGNQEELCLRLTLTLRIRPGIRSYNMNIFPFPISFSLTLLLPLWSQSSSLQE